MHRQVSELSARVESVSTKQESDYEVLNDQISDVQIYAENADKKLSNYKVENENSNAQMLNTFETLNDKLSKLKKATKEKVHFDFCNAAERPPNYFEMCAISPCPAR